MYNSGKNVWAKEFRERRADVPMETIEKYLHNLYRLRPDFVYSVSRDFARTVPDASACPAGRRCRRTRSQTSIDIASLCPNAEITVFPWKDPPELKARTINRVRTFLEGASNGVGAPARLTGLSVCVGFSPERSSTAQLWVVSAVLAMPTNVRSAPDTRRDSGHSR